jgi:hypothetical protein
VIDAWVGSMRERNIDGAALLADARAMIQKHGGAGA